VKTILTSSTINSMIDYLVAQCNGVDFRSPPTLSTIAPLETKYLKPCTTYIPQPTFIQLSSTQAQKHTSIYMLLLLLLLLLLLWLLQAWAHKIFIFSTEKNLKFQDIFQDIRVTKMRFFVISGAYNFGTFRA